MIKLDFIIFLCTLVIFGFILGWIFPVEGPIDYVYDNVVKKKVPDRAAPVLHKAVLIDLNNDDEMETYYLMPEIIEEKENE